MRLTSLLEAAQAEWCELERQLQERVRGGRGQLLFFIGRRYIGVASCGSWCPCWWGGGGLGWLWRRAPACEASVHNARQMAEVLFCLQHQFSGRAIAPV